MRRNILIVVLALGTFAGFGAEVFSSTHHRHSCHSRQR